jgi:phospholipid/cholesterol/gamma-HCH transport system permease protein
LVRLSGPWTIGGDRALEDAAAEIERAGERFGSAIIDLSDVTALDTAGAWVVDRARARLAGRGVADLAAVLELDQAARHIATGLAAHRAAA